MKKKTSFNLSVMM